MLNAAAMQAAGLGGMAPGSVPVGLPPPPPLAGAPAAVPNAFDADAMNGPTGASNEQAQPQEHKDDPRTASTASASMSDPFGVGTYNSSIPNAFPGMMGGNAGAHEFLQQQQQQQQPITDANNTQSSTLASPSGFSDYNAELGGTGLSPPASGAPGGGGGGGGEGEGSETMRLIQQLQSQLHQQQQIIKESSQQIGVENGDKKSNGDEDGVEDDTFLPEGAEPEPLPDMPMKGPVMQATAAVGGNKMQQFQNQQQSLGNFGQSLSGSAAPMAAPPQMNNAYAFLQAQMQQQPALQQQQNQIQQTQPPNGIGVGVDNETYHSMLIGQLAEEANREISDK